MDFALHQKVVLFSTLNKYALITIMLIVIINKLQNKSSETVFHFFFLIQLNIVYIFSEINY